MTVPRDNILLFAIAQPPSLEPMISHADCEVLSIAVRIRLRCAWNPVMTVNSVPFEANCAMFCV